MYKIAVIDDNEAWCFVVAAFFREQGFEVATFSDSSAFLQYAEQAQGADQVDLALVDFSIPPRRYQKNTDGPDVIRQLKERLETPPLLVLISAFFTEEILSDVEDLCPQADAFLSKSTGLQGILQQVKQLLGITVVDNGELFSSLPGD